MSKRFFFSILNNHQKLCTMLIKNFLCASIVFLQNKSPANVKEELSSWWR